VISHYAPTAPTLVREPFHRDGWVYEEKVDGWRMLVYKDGARASSAATPATIRAVLDGEVAIFDQQLRSRFDWPPRQP
jgi:ATP-dependent DNA ligase